MRPTLRSVFPFLRILQAFHVSVCASTESYISSCIMPSYKFPETLKEFGFAFNAEGKLRQIDENTGEAGNQPFVFNVKPDPVYNQKRYEALGELITLYVYDLLSKQEGLLKLPVPENQTPSTFVFASEDALTNPDKLMILIHGSGVVRAGQWARKLIINDCLHSGTQIPYIQRAKAQGYGVLVLNTNDNERTVDGKVTSIKGSSNPLEHANWVWEHYVKLAKARKIAVVAHSFGGVCAVQLAQSYFDDFRSRVFAIALTDSVHQYRLKDVESEVAEYLHKVGRNWVSSSDPLDKEQKGNKKSDITCVSAGHHEHEMTSFSCMDSLFKYLENLLLNSTLS